MLVNPAAGRTGPSAGLRAGTTAAGLPSSEAQTGVASLFVIQGPNRGTRFELDGSPAIGIGREAGNAVQLQDSEVSRRHAEIRPAAAGFLVADLKSSNGTFVNGRRVERAELAGGDQIQVGRSLLVYALEAEVPHAASGSVDIVGPATGDDGSRIVRTLREDEPIVAGPPPGETDNRWLARARSNLQVMYRTALAVSHTLDIDELLARILNLVFEWVEADRGCIMLRDPGTGQLRAKARRDRRPGATGSMAISRTILDYVLERHEGVLTSDAQDDDRFSSGTSVLRTGVREAICVPMQGRYGTVGILYVDTTVPLAELATSGQRRFNDEHLKLMIAIGHQAALAVEDTTYYSAMVQAERLAGVGQTIATLSHHIKNILQGIRGGSYLVEMGLENDDQALVRKGWDIVARNQGKISSLVMDMLSYSKEREPDSVPSDLVATVTDVIDTVRHRAEEAGTALDWRPPDGLPRMLFDPEGISRAVLNVVTNALDAVEGRSDGRVQVGVAIDDATARARITVADNGPGMPAETLARIFNLFVSTKGSRGTGLGLTVSRKILREHEGDIVATSTEGVGSRFVLELPVRIAAHEGMADGSATGLHAGPQPDERPRG
jgi:signal transduction histidine kinase